jgi:hypothetical protein
MAVAAVRPTRQFTQYRIRKNQQDNSVMTHNFGRVALIAMPLFVVSSAHVTGQEPEKPEREQIGEVLGKPVYRDQIRTGKDIHLRDELQRLLGAPVLQKYREQHKAEVEPTKAEIDAAAIVFDRDHQARIKDEEPQMRERLAAVEQELAKPGLTPERQKELERDRTVLQIQLKPPGRFFAQFVLDNWKFQRHLYDRFGGGRILWQQAGLEAFDAMHKWLQAQEEAGQFKITDPRLRASFYEYWTTMNHGAFLIEDKERIRKEFLEPEWAPKWSGAAKDGDG